jgi:serine protease inhibitor
MRMLAVLPLMLCLCLSAGCAQAEESDDIASAQSKFGLKLLRAMSEKSDSNIFISPLSIHACLSMVYPGASEQTAQELSQVLELNNSSSAMKAYKTYLTSLSSPLPGKADDVPSFGSSPERTPVEISFASSLWASQTVKFHLEFLKEVQGTFDAEFATVNFATPEAKEKINNWVADKTRGKIPTIINDTKDLDAALVNAAYFKAAWAKPFEEQSTQSADFESAPGKKVQVPMMASSSERNYYEDQDVQVVTLPYSDYRYSMTIVLPRKKIDTQTLGAMLTPENWMMWNAQTSKLIALKTPKFKLNFGADLIPPLKAIGLKNALSKEANYSKMASPKLIISTVKHKTFVTVDEKGTEAAAATIVGFEATSARVRPQPIVMTVNHPFFVTLNFKKDITSKSPPCILFAGLVASPGE